MVNLNELVEQARAMQEKVRLAQEELEKIDVEGVAVGPATALVKVTMSCLKVAKRVSIDPSLIAVEQKENLEDLLVAAFNNAKEKAEEISTATMEEATGGLQLPAGV
ncbi:MAG: YbaB/EbfC family nucleoid-associated protein [Rickettsiales bacterium]|jgi:DNA-binding YbaB/EbfC family protein|nr:YbaB/EbfC family nucleoid-associated protein [Rickettsiales bacterium]